LLKIKWFAYGTLFAFVKRLDVLNKKQGGSLQNNFSRRSFMDQRDFKKFLAGLSITTLVAGVTIMGVGFPEPAQAA
jgi:radical SAM modification target selenobiotic family peptide